MLPIPFISQVVSFREMAKVVAEEWKSIDPETKAYAESVANIQKIRYNRIREETIVQAQRRASISSDNVEDQPTVSQSPVSHPSFSPSADQPTVSRSPICPLPSSSSLAFPTQGTSPVKKVDDSQFYRQVTVDPYHYEVDLSDDDIISAYLS